MNKFFNPIFLQGILLLVFLNFSTAQDLKPKNGLMIGVNLINHEFPLTNTLENTNVYTAALELGYARKLHPHFNLLVPVQFGKATYPTIGDSLGDSQLFGSVDALGQVLFTKRKYYVTPYAVLGLAGEIHSDGGEGAFGVLIPVGLGIDVNIRPNLSLGLRAEYRFGVETYDNLQFNLGLSTYFASGKNKKKLSDSDSDGVTDDKDDCPTVPGLITTNGCPDADNDGVADQKDECPEEPGYEKYNGCPFLDTDKDGVKDSEDRCPDRKGSPELGGCPDADGDGVADVDDLCPNAAGDKKMNGCPDSDGDGVPDISDKCPEIAGDNKGCPSLTAGEIDFLKEVPQKVEFEFGNSTLTAASSAELDRIVAIMKKHPAYHLKIGGHTDSIGADFENQKLSERRARACFDFFIKKGISKGRMTYEGFGEKVPVATNMYKDGRQQNRRVEFEVFLPE